MVEAERSFEERFSETVRQFPVIYDNEMQGAYACTLVSVLVVASLQSNVFGGNLGPLLNI